MPLPNSTPNPLNTLRVSTLESCECESMHAPLFGNGAWREVRSGWDDGEGARIIEGRYDDHHYAFIVQNAHHGVPHRTR